MFFLQSQVTNSTNFMWGVQKGKKNMGHQASCFPHLWQESFNRIKILPKSHRQLGGMQNPFRNPFNWELGVTVYAWNPNTQEVYPEFKVILAIQRVWGQPRIIRPCLNISEKSVCGGGTSPLCNHNKDIRPCLKTSGEKMGVNLFPLM